MDFVSVVVVGFDWNLVRREGIEVGLDVPPTNHEHSEVEEDACKELYQLYSFAQYCFASDSHFLVMP